MAPPKDKFTTASMLPIETLPSILDSPVTRSNDLQLATCYVLLVRPAIAFLLFYSALCRERCPPSPDVLSIASRSLQRYLTLSVHLFLYPFVA